MNSQNNVSSSNCFAWMVRLHLNAYRSVCRGIEHITVTAVNIIFRPQIPYGTFENIGSGVRNIGVVDYGCTTAMRVAERSLKLISDEQIIDPESLKTRSQRKKEREIVQLRNELAGSEIYSIFCRETAHLISELFPKIVGEQLKHIPPMTEMTALYRAGLTIRYINHKINQWTNCRRRVIDSGSGKALNTLYTGLSNKFAHQLLSYRNVNPIINFEHIFLKLCAKIKPKTPRNPNGSPMGNLLIKSLSESLTLMQQADTFLAEQTFSSKEEAFIARLDWYKKHHCLPRGLPDPHEVSLNTGNLQDQINESLSEYLEHIAELFLNKVCPKKFKNKLLNVFFKLEGKDALIKIISFLLGDLGIKQVADPHLFTLAILYARGEEITDYELNGFGRDKKETILSAGRDMMKEVLKKDFSSKSVVSIFERTTLKQCPGSYEGIMQEKEAREELRKLIFTFIYGAIKEDAYKHDGQLDSIRKKMSELPILGLATTTLHVLCNGMIFSLGYLIRDNSQKDVTFISHLLRHFSGKKLCLLITDRIMELISHPGWYFVILHFIESINRHIHHQAPTQIPDQRTPEDHLKTILRYMFQHFSKDLGVSIEGLFDYLTGEEALKEMRSYLRPSGKPLLEVGMESLLPTIKEYLLYTRVTSWFRKDFIQFEGDDKFWEFFIREYLNQLQKLQTRRDLKEGEKPEIASLNEFRERIVDQLLTYNKQKIRELFSDEPTLEPFIKLPKLEALADAINTPMASINAACSSLASKEPSTTPFELEALANAINTPIASRKVVCSSSDSTSKHSPVQKIIYVPDYREENRIPALTIRED